jgi:1-phosphofructokinase
MIYTVTFNPAIDYVVRLDAPLEVGQVNRACGEDCVLGGKGINVSGVLAQLGCPSVALGFVAGETGAWLERGLAAQGLHTDFVHLENGMTRINVKIKAGQETELNGAGPDIPDEALHQLEEKLDGLTENDVLILAGSIPASLPQDVYERLVSRPVDGHARTHSEVVQMICTGVCGAFNPLLLDCLQDMEAEIARAMQDTPEET